MSLRVYSNRFLMLRNHTGMVVPRAFHSCWKLLAFDQIQLDAYCTVVWRWFEATFKLRSVIPIFERNEMTEFPRKPRQPTSIGITWHIQLFSTQSARSVSYRFFFRSCASSRFSSQGIVNSMRRTVFFESDHATMSGRFSVWIMWTGNCRDVLRSVETFQSLAPFISFISGFFCFLTGHSPSLRNWIMGSLAVIGCWFAVSYCAFNNSITTSNTLLCRHVYIWGDCWHADSIWRKVPWSVLYDKHKSELIYPHNFRLVAFGKRSYVERRRNDIASGSIAIKDFHDNLIGSISFHFVQAHCLAWVTVQAVLCSSSNILTSSLIMSLFPFMPALENTFLLVLPSPARLVWVTSMMSLIRRLHSASWTALTADHFVPNFISGYAFQIISSAESFIMWRRTFPILNSSTSEDIGSCRFPELVYKPTFEKQGGTPSHLRRYLLLYCWISSTRDSSISYICKGHKIRGSIPCW